MAELAVGLLGPVIEVVKLVAKPIARQCNYLCCFTSNIDSLKEEKKKLDDALAGLEGEVDSKGKNNEDPYPQVKTWITHSKKIQDEISGILDEAKNVESVCSKLGDRFRLSRRAKKKTECMKVHRGEIPPAQFFPPPTAAMQGVQLEKPFECESRNMIEEEIMATLRGGDVKMIGICGMGGLGKTTMAKKIMNKALHESVFEEVVIATVSENVDISKIQDEIGGQLGLDKLKDEKSEFARARILLSRLSDKKRRTLVVLDDIWKKPSLESIGIPIDSNTDVCTVLITSRNRDVLHDMKVQIFGMEELSEEEAWSFFREEAGKCADDEKLEDTPRQVAKACGGLPINLAAVGAGLRDERNAAIWEHAVTQLKESVPGKVQSDLNYKPLEWSYDRLDSEKAKSIFLLCCVFPEDADIPLELLTYFCMGLRILEKEAIAYKKAWNWVCNETKMLKDRSLLLKSDKKHCVRMHDVVRVVCTSIAKQSKDCGRWISSSHLVEETKELLSESRCPHLRLLFLNGRYDDAWRFKIVNAFVEGMRELRVLCIQNYDSFTTVSLGKVINTLILDSCNGLKTISVVGELVNLEILICRYCYWIEELPSEMKGLNRLKVLELTGCGRLQRIGRGIISSLVGLEELKMLKSFNKWEEKGNARLRELEALTNLACLEIDIDDPSLLMEKMPLLLNKNIGRFIIKAGSWPYGDLPAEFSKAMSLALRETGIRDWMMQLLRDSECVHLSGYGASDVDLAKSQNIRWLELHNCLSMKNVVRTSGGDDAIVFPLIEHLKIEDLFILQEICDGPISSGSFQNLKELELKYLSALTQFWKSSSVCENNYVPHFSNLSSIHIYKCHCLRNLGQLSMARKDCLPQLQHLSIIECEMMEQVFLWNGGEAGENKTSNESQRKRQVIFPKLKKVVLDSLPNLTKVIEDEQQQERILVFPKLEILLLEKLPKLVSFSEWKCDVELPLLRKVDIRSCSNMEHHSMGLLAAPNLEAFTTDLTTYDGVGVDVAFNSLKKLKIKENENPWYDDKISVSLFNGLEKLIFDECKGGSMSLFSSLAVGNLVNLTVLEIKYSGGILVTVIKDDKAVGSGGEITSVVFPKLERLSLFDLPKLVRFSEWKCAVELPSLTKVEIDDCPYMESFSIGLVATPNLKSVEIDHKDIGATKDLNAALQQHYLARPEKVSFKLEIDYNPFYGHKVPSSLCNRLEVLKIKKYKGNMSIFTLSVAANLVSLRELSLIKCKEMIKVIEDKEQQERILVFPKLEELYLKDLPKLVSLCDSKCEVELPLLREVKLERCPNMENFSIGLVATPNLEAFKTDLCTSIGVGVDVAFNNLKTLMITENENPFDHHKISISVFNGLESLILYDFRGSVSLFPSSAVGSLVNLRVLGIGKCDDIVKVFEDDEEKVVSGGEIRRVVFPKLEELHLSKLPKLARLCEWKCDVELPSLTEVEIESCPKMESISMGVVVAPNLKTVEIDKEEIDATKDLNGALHQHYLARQEEEINEEEESSEEDNETQEKYEEEEGSSEEENERQEKYEEEEEESSKDENETQEEYEQVIEDNY